jgi:hypothetical protein
LQPIAGGFDDRNLDRMAMAAKKRRNVLRLPQGQL